MYQGFTQQVSDRPESNPGLPPEPSFFLLVQLPPAEFSDFMTCRIGTWKEGDLPLPREPSASSDTA